MGWVQVTLPGEIHYRSLENILANDERPRGLGLPYGQGKIIRAQRYDATNILCMDRLPNIASEDVRIVRLRNTRQSKLALGRESDKRTATSTVFSCPTREMLELQDDREMTAATNT
jgi:hypothetical protein